MADKFNKKTECRRIFFVEFIPVRYIVSNIDTRTDVNHNKILLVKSIYATCFGRADHPQAFKIHDFKTQNKMHIYIKLL